MRCLHLAGLRLKLCRGLARLRRLRRLALGRASAGALVTEELEALMELVALVGQGVALEAVGIYGLSAWPSSFPPRRGLGEVGQLQLLLEMMPFLPLKELDLSQNGVAQALRRPC